MTQLATAFANVIINPLLLLLFAAGVLVFVFGIVEFFFELDVRGNQSAKENGKNHMLWGLIGLFVMSSVLAIINLIQNTISSIR